MARTTWTQMMAEPAALAIDSLRTERARSALAIAGIVIGIVTVVLVASVLANVRNQVALLFRDLGTDNVFAFHLTGDPYVTPNEKEARRKPLKLAFVRDIARLGTAIRDVGAQVIVPTTRRTARRSSRGPAATSRTRCSSRAPRRRSSTSSAPSSRGGRPFTELEDREGAHVAVVGASLAKALFGSASPLGQTLTLAGDTYTVVGELAKRRGGFFGENRQDNVLNLPAGTVRNRFGEPERVVLYMRAKPGQREACFAAGRGDPAAAAQAAADGRERLHPLHGGSDHRDVRRPERAHRAGHGRPGGRQPAHRRDRHRQRDVHQRDRAHARDRAAARRRRAAPAGARAVPARGGVPVGHRRRRRRRRRAGHRPAAHPGRLGLLGGRAAVGDRRGARAPRSASASSPATGPR